MGTLSIIGVALPIAFLPSKWSEPKVTVLDVRWPGNQLCQPHQRGLLPGLLFASYSRSSSLKSAEIIFRQPSVRLGARSADIIPSLNPQTSIVFLADGSSCGPSPEGAVSLADKLISSGFDVAYAARTDVDGIGWQLFALGDRWRGKDVLFYFRANRLVEADDTYLVTEDIWQLYRRDRDVEYVKDNSYTASFILDNLKKSHPRSITLIVETSVDEDETS